MGVHPGPRPDDRGVFLESFTASDFLAASGHAFDLRQMNISVSKAGTVRGVHFADVPPGQAKYVQCFAGSILDIVVDIRVGSPTFGQFDAVELNDRTRTGLYVAEGLGHGFCALSTRGHHRLPAAPTPYTPAREHGIHPLDPTLDLPWPDLDLVISAKDQQAPTLADALAQGLLPDYAACQEFTNSLR